MPNMSDKIKDRLNSRVKLIKALAHPSRLLMVEKLAIRPICVCDLTEMVGADISTVSKHLAVLKKVGLVKDEKRGTQVFYKLACPCVLSFFECIENIYLETL